MQCSHSTSLPRTIFPDLPGNNNSAHELSHRSVDSTAVQGAYIGDSNDSKTDEAISDETATQNLKLLQVDDDDSPWSKPVTLLVGPAEVPFIVPAQRLRDIPFFRACLELPMQERATNMIRLPEWDPVMFRHVHSFWLTNGFKLDLMLLVEKDDGDIDETDLELPDYEELTETDLEEAIEEIVDVYMFGDMVDDEELQNLAVDQLAQTYRRKNYALWVIEFAANRDKGDMLRDLILFHICVDIMQHGWDLYQKTSYEWEILLSKDDKYLHFILEGMIKFSHMSSQVLHEPVFGASPCQFHKHERTPLCDDSPIEPVLRSDIEAAIGKLAVRNDAY
jgi:hypothetical protein